MTKENHFESWNKTIKEVYGSEETDSLQVANEGSTITMKEEKELPTIEDYNKRLRLSKTKRDE